MTRRLLFHSFVAALFGQQIGPMLWSDCGRTPPQMLITFQEFEDLNAILRAAQTPANSQAVEKACGVLRMAVGQELVRSVDGNVSKR